MQNHNAVIRRIELPASYSEENLAWDRTAATALSTCDITPTKECVSKPRAPDRRMCLWGSRLCSKPQVSLGVLVLGALGVFHVATHGGFFLALLGSDQA